MVNKELTPRRRILQAAFHSFCLKGFKGTTTREIAQLAKVNIAMVHYYFDNKEDLYLRVVRPIFILLSRRLRRAATSSGDPNHCLSAVIDAYFDFLLAFPLFPRLMMWELAEGAPRVKRIMAQSIQKNKKTFFSIIGNMFAEGQQKGVFTLDSPEHATLSLMGLCVYPFAAQVMMPVVLSGDFQLENFAAERRRHTKNLLMKGFSMKVAVR
ncbi:MAG: TetR family transcriptional regulator [bacterium]|nr:TetR family transcriptional regulator [bacterium]